MSYPYSLKTGSIKDFFTKLKSTGVPEKVTIQYLVSLGYKSKNDRAIIPLLKFIGFLSAGGQPTDLYTQYRGKDGHAILAQGIQDGYKELYSVYPDAHNKDDESLIHFFATHTKAGDKVLRQTVATFKTVCELADFEAETIQSGESNSLKNGADEVPVVEGTSNTVPVVNSALPITINIELQIPHSADADFFENFFKSMKKHLIKHED